MLTSSEVGTVTYLTQAGIEHDLLNYLHLYYYKTESLVSNMK